MFGTARVRLIKDPTQISKCTSYLQKGPVYNIYMP